MVRVCLLAVVLLPNVWAVHGRVVDATTREPLSRVSVRALGTGAQTATDGQGMFELDVEEGEIQVSSVGFRPLRIRVEAGHELEISLMPDTLRQKESVDVSAGPFGIEGPDSLSLRGNELRNLASVLADDPLRAVQGLPGVTSNDDFQSQLSLRGAGFRRIGIYADGILLHSPYHTLQADPQAASLTILSSDLLESAVLHSGAPPPQFADRSAAALDLRLRDGDRKKVGVRGSLSASNASLVVEGPLSSRRTGSWLVSARKSYLQYLIKLSSDQPSIAFGYKDVQGRLTQDVGRGHAVTFGMMDGSSGLDRGGAEGAVGLNTMFRSDYHYTLGEVQSRWTPAGAWLIQNTVAWTRERYFNTNREQDPLAGGRYGEWVYQADNRWQFRDDASFGFGFSFRRLRDFGFQDQRLRLAPFARRVDQYDGTGTRSGGFVSQQFAVWKGRLQLRAGGRLDTDTLARGVVVSPVAGATLQVASGTHLNLAWGNYVQYPELSTSYSIFGRQSLLPERSIHTQVGLEQRLDDKTRLRVEAYQRLDRDLIFRPLGEPRRLNGRIFGGEQEAPYENSTRGYARGLQFFVQRRTSNGLTGWVAYTYGVSRMRDSMAGGTFPSDYDQRHTANVFLSYRLRPTVNLSGRWTYGSGFPVLGFVQGGGPYFLSEARNVARMPAYHRLDTRLNKTFVRRGWHITLFAEVVNVYNRVNERLDSFGGIDARTGAIRVNFDRTFPVLPSAGMAVEF